MKFTSALSAIALVVFAQTVAASPALAKTDVKTLQNEFLDVRTVATRDGVVLWEKKAHAKIVNILVDKNVTHANVTPDTVETLITVFAQNYEKVFLVATSQLTLD